MGDGNLDTVYMSHRRRGRGVTEVSGKLVSVKVEIHPSVCRTALSTTEQLPVKPPVSK